jgi:hypothetical protein
MVFLTIAWQINTKGDVLIQIIVARVRRRGEYIHP